MSRSPIKRAVWARPPSAAALARLAAGLGLSVLIVEVEGKSGLSAAFGAEELDDLESRMKLLGYM